MIPTFTLEQGRVWNKNLKMVRFFSGSHLTEGPGAGADRGNLDSSDLNENFWQVTKLSTKRSTQKRYGIPRGVWLCLLLILYYTVTQLLTIIFTSIKNQQTNQLINKQTEKELLISTWLNWVAPHSSRESSKTKTFKTNWWIIIVFD